VLLPVALLAPNRAVAHVFARTALLENQALVTVLAATAMSEANREKVWNDELAFSRWFRRGGILYGSTTAYSFCRLRLRCQLIASLLALPHL